MRALARSGRTPRSSPSTSSAMNALASIPAQLARIAEVPDLRRGHALQPHGHAVHPQGIAIRHPSAADQALGSALAVADGPSRTSTISSLAAHLPVIPSTHGRRGDRLRDSTDVPGALSTVLWTRVRMFLRRMPALGQATSCRERALGATHWPRSAPAQSTPTGRTIYCADVTPRLGLVPPAASRQPHRSRCATIA